MNQAALMSDATSQPADIGAILSRLTFKFAKTMPDTPHEYTTRNKADPQAEADYVALFNACHEFGVRRKFGKYWYKYLRHGEYEYWAMTTFLPISRIINRAKVKDERQDASGG